MLHGTCQMSRGIQFKNIRYQHDFIGNHILSASNFGVIQWYTISLEHVLLHVLRYIILTSFFYRFHLMCELRNSITGCSHSGCPFLWRGWNSRSYYKGNPVSPYLFHSFYYFYEAHSCLRGSYKLTRFTCLVCNILIFQWHATESEWRKRNNLTRYTSVPTAKGYFAISVILEWWLDVFSTSFWWILVYYFNYWDSFFSIYKL